ncbi:MAG: hypothetical protein NTX87_02960, partial [Planctomycetota bacterium]|nr:hypothetical protein [Planctomycetota bacterium]
MSLVGALYTVNDEFIWSGGFTQSGGSSSNHSVSLHVGGVYVQNDGANATGYLSVGGFYNIYGGLLSVSGDMQVTGTGLFIQNGGTHNVSGNLEVGDLSGGMAAYTMDHGPLSISGDLRVSAASLFSQEGGTCTVYGWTSLDGTCKLERDSVLSALNEEAINGTFTQTGGTHNVSGSLTVGWDAAGQGRYVQTGGSLLSTGEAFIAAQGAGSLGYVSISNTGSRWEHTGDVTVGRNGSGYLTVSDCGVVKIVGGGLTIGEADTASGSVTVSGTASSLDVAMDLRVGGDFGSGYLEVADSASLQVSQQLQVGNKGDGWVRIVRGGRIEVGGDMTLGLEEAGSGDVTVEDGGSELEVGGDMILGFEGWGSGSVSGGAQVHVTGGLMMASGSSLSIDTGSDFDAGWVHVDGPSESRIGGLLTLLADGELLTDFLTVGGTFEDDDPYAIAVESNGGAPGLLYVSGATVIASGALIVLPGGSVTVDAGYLQAPQALVSGGTFTSNGGQAVFGSSTDTGYALMIEGNPSTGVAGTLNVNGGLVAAPGGLCMGPGGIVNLTAGQLTATEVLVSGGTFTAGGGLAVFGPALSDEITVEGDPDTGTPGTFTVNGATVLAAQSLYVKSGGTVTVTSGNLTVGTTQAAAMADGALTVLPTGAVTVDGGSVAAQTVALQGGAIDLNSGSLTTGGLTITQGGEFNLYSGSLTYGDLTISQGGSLVQGSSAVAWATGTQATVTDPDSLWDCSSTAVFSVGTRTLVPLYQLSILNGGELSAANVQIGEISPAAALVSGTDSYLSVSGSLYVGGTASGPGAAGVLTVGSGATVDVGGTAVVWGLGTVVLSGGTLNVSSGLNVKSGGTVTVASGNLTVGTTQAASPAMADGALTVLPTGEVTVDGGSVTAQTVALQGGNIDLNSGSLTTGGVTINQGGTFTANGGQAVFGSSTDAEYALMIEGDPSTGVTGTLNVNGGLVAAPGGLCMGPGGIVNLTAGQLTATEVLVS